MKQERDKQSAAVQRRDGTSGGRVEGLEAPPQSAKVRAPRPCGLVAVLGASERWLGGLLRVIPAGHGLAILALQAPSRGQPFQLPRFEWAARWRIHRAEPGLPLVANSIYLVAAGERLRVGDGCCWERSPVPANAETRALLLSLAREAGARAAFIVHDHAFEDRSLESALRGLSEQASTVIMARSTPPAPPGPGSAWMQAQQAGQYELCSEPEALVDKLLALGQAGVDPPQGTLAGAARVLPITGEAGPGRGAECARGEARAPQEAGPRLRVEAAPRRLRSQSQQVERALSEADEELAVRRAEAAEVLHGEQRMASTQRSATRQRDEFLAMLSHELRNPLAVIRNATQVLVATGGSSCPRAARCEELILRQVDHMAGLLRNLLDASRVTRGKVVLERQRVNLRAALGDALEAVADGARRRNQEIRLCPTNEPLLVYGDPARLRQIHENLLSNAIKYTPFGGQIELRMFRDHDRAVVQVRDTGRGIASDQLEAIFELFAQGKADLARSDGGMGIGLTLVRSLVELHGGAVAAHSDGLGRGSTFEVRLPLDPREPLLQRDEQECSMQGDQSTSRKFEARDILVIEDNADARETLQLLLELDGHRVRVAGDGEEGLAAIEAQPPQIAFVDIGLPRVDGFELARRVRAQGDRSKLRLIALTGYGRSEDRRAIEEAGFDMHLVKPVSHEALRGAIESSAD